MIQRGFLASFPCSVAGQSCQRAVTALLYWGNISQLRRNGQALGWGARNVRVAEFRVSNTTPMTQFSLCRGEF